MIAAVRRAWDNFRGAGEAGVTVPPMDGALRPNQLLEHATLLATMSAPDAVAVMDDRVIVSSGTSVVALDAAGKTETIQSYNASVTALAVGPDATIAVGLDDGRVILRGPAGERTIDRVGGRRLVCPTALLFDGDGSLVIAEGSSERAPSQWKRDVMDRAATGSVWRVPVSGGDAALIASRLAWPYGLAAAPGGALAIAESWRHRIVLARQGSALQPVLADLPGYPARLSAASDGGYWLCIFAPRNQLIEFVQREPEFLQRMTSEIDPDHWVAPSLTSARTFLVPLQGGAQKHLGMLKPWAPTFSYGLVVRLDDRFRPNASYHSRADGTRHGVTGCAEHAGALVVASRGGDALLSLLLRG